ncbi:MAG: preprotein translocase subunit SecG [Deltaproteobacteria bacterium]|nr:preprotein translocase subunit SecG [Deltaproteobacteria bacterium]
MTSIIIAVHVVVCLVLIVVILLQSGSAGGMGAAFGGGGSQTLFGGSGSGKFFTRLTAIVAGIFMITSISLTVMSAHRAKGTVMEDYSPAAVTAPAEPANTAAPIAAPPVPVEKSTPAQTSEKPAKTSE